MNSPPGKKEAALRQAAPDENSIDIGTLTDPAHEGKPDVHVLKTNGVVIEATLDPRTFQLNCAWNPSPPYTRKKLKRIAKDYIPWRNGIVDKAARSAGIRVMVVTPGIDGTLLTDTLGGTP